MCIYIYVNIYIYICNYISICIIKHIEYHVIVDPTATSRVLN